MSRWLLKLGALILAIAPAALAQSGAYGPLTGGGGPIAFAGVPSGSCTATQQAVDTTTGNTYSCLGGAWVPIGGGGAITLAQTPLTTDQDALIDIAGVLGRLPLVNLNTCLGNTGGQWASLACNNTPGGTNQQLQYNNAGGVAGFGSFNNSTLLTTFPGGTATTSDGVHAADSGWVGNTAYYTPIVNTAGFAGPNIASFTGWRFGLPSTPCATNTTFLYGSPSGGITPITCGAVPHAAIAATAVTPGSYTCTNATIAADGSITAAANGSCGGGSGGAAGSFAQAFASQTSVTITGATHGLGTANMVVEVYDGASPAARVRPAKVTVDATTFAVVVTFNNSQSGTIVLVAGASKYVAAFASTTSLSVTAATHKLGASIFHVTVFDASSGTRNRIRPGNVAIDASGNVTVAFAVAQAGQIVIE